MESLSPGNKNGELVSNNDDCLGYADAVNNNSLFTINHLQRTNKDDNNTLTTKIHEKL